MALPADDVFPKRDELASHELSIEELDAIAAGSILGSIWHWAVGEVKGYVNEKINEGKMFAGAVVDMGRSIISLF